jgi:hypothetical protein
MASMQFTLGDFALMLQDLRNFRRFRRIVLLSSEFASRKTLHRLLKLRGGLFHLRRFSPS